MSGQFGHPFQQQRDRSPAHRTEHKISNPFEHHQSERHKTVFQEMTKPPSSKPMDMFQSVDSIPKKSFEPNPPSRMISPSEASSSAEACILSQIYYCRFMSNLCDLLEENSQIPEVYLLKAELVNKILGKCEGLKKLREGDNVFQIEGFSLYKNTEKWIRLKDIIQKYSDSYR